MYKITIEDEGSKCTVESDSVSLDELIPDIMGALIGVGFHPASVEKFIDNPNGSWFPEEDA